VSSDLTGLSVSLHRNAAFAFYSASALAASNKPGSSCFLSATTSSSDVVIISPLVNRAYTPLPKRNSELPTFRLTIYRFSSSLLFQLHSAAFRP
jgi:hypothetical protein